MTKEQEEKFENWRMDNESTYPPYNRVAREAWEACTKANGIGEDMKGKDDESVAPQWVIDMIRTGKPVRCKVWDGIEEVDKKVFVTGYDVKDIHPFCDEYGTTWHHAEPIPAWKPKDGEAVLTPVVGRSEIGYIKGGFMLVRGMTIPIEQAEMKPLDVDKLGDKWSEI